MKILLAVDGSDQSDHAARALAHLSPADRLIVLHAVDVPKPAYPMIMPEVAHGIYTTLERTMREDGERLLNRISSILSDQAGPVSKRLEVGRVAEMILAVVEKEQVDLIVLGARGLGPVRELVLGSVSHRVLAHASCSTLVVNQPLPSLRRVLLAVEGIQDAESACRFLALKPFREPVEVTVLTVLPFAQPIWPAGLPDSEALKANLVKSARNFAWDVATRLSRYHYIATAAVAEGAPAVEILQEASRTKPDLILMGSRSREGPSRFLLGSVSHAVLHRASCPTLVFR